MKITDCIKCPKCYSLFLKQNKKSTKAMLDWFCHKCHTYFSTHELVNQWGLDAGDLYGDYRDGNDVDAVPLRHAYSEFDSGEPMWTCPEVRHDAYDMVSRMFLGISNFYDDLTDLIDTQEGALDRSIQ